MTAAKAVNARVHARTTVSVCTDMAIGLDSSWAEQRLTIVRVEHANGGNSEVPADPS